MLPLRVANLTPLAADGSTIFPSCARHILQWFICPLQVLFDICVLIPLSIGPMLSAVNVGSFHVYT